MADWLDFVMGPLLRFSLALMLLGFMRQLLLWVVALYHARKASPETSVSLREALWRTIARLFPLEHLRSRSIYSLVSIVFHLGIILVPLGYAGHIAYLRAGVGLGWPALDEPVIRVLTLGTICAALVLFLGRLLIRNLRRTSRFGDYIFPLLIAVPFISGYLLARPLSNPFPHDLILLVHVLSAEVIFIAFPFSKLSHSMLLAWNRFAGVPLEERRGEPLP